MSKARKSEPSVSKRFNINGAHAVMGMDIVSFSTLHDDDQIQAIDHLIRWINEALAFHSITDNEYRWSPAGDGGYLTFATATGCRKAIDVAFAICHKCQYPNWRPRNGEKVRLRLALHAGTVQEARELGRNTNIWGMGINMAARILSVAAPSQLLMSKQYYDSYIKGQRESEFQIGDVHWRTVKHGVQVEVQNVNRDSLCLNEDHAKNMRWQAVGGLWRKTIQEYTFLIHDTMKSGEPVAALAAAKFLLDLGEEKAVRELCCMVGSTDERPTQNYPRQHHPMFSEMPPDVLFQVIRAAAPRVVRANQVICERGDPAESCFFPVSGTIVVELPGQDRPIRIATGQIIGEFSLWIPNLARTARLRAIDDALLLEIHEAEFERILAQAPHVAEVVYGIIKRRMLENVLKSKKLFPRESDVAESVFRDMSASCEKIGKDVRLDLSTSTYVLFNGRVQIEPPEGEPLVVVAPGVFGAEQVVGIVSELGSPDGANATTLEETVAIRMDHDAVRALQEFDSVQTAWNALCGQRIGEIRRRGRDPRKVELSNSAVLTAGPAAPNDLARGTLTRNPLQPVKLTQESDATKGSDLPMSSLTPPRVLISYSHDSDAHSKRVLDFSGRLRRNGIDCRIDQYIANPSEGWPLWMDKQVEEADFVLVLFTERYATRSREPRKSGVRFESVLILQDLYEAGMINDKFIPVLFDGADSKHIVKWLKPFNYYTVDGDSGYESLRRRLLNDPAVVMPPLGVPTKKGPANP